MATAKKAKKAGKKEKGEAKKSPLEKAREAKKAGKGKKGSAKKAKRQLPVFKAPEEFKPFFFRAIAKIGKDGFVTDMKVTRIKGSPKNENAKTVDMALHDPLTFARICTRYGTGTFVTNPDKRLPAGMALKFLGRVSVKSATGGLNVGLKEFRLVDLKTKKGKEIGPKTKEAPIYRLARKPAKFMAAAFVGTKPFPSAAEIKELTKGQDEEGKVKVKSKVKEEKKKAKKKGKGKK